MENSEQPLLQSLVSHDPSQMIPICLFDAWKTCLIINVKNIVYNSCFGETDTVVSKLFEEIESSKEQCLFEIENLCNIINVFTAGPDQFISDLTF